MCVLIDFPKQISINFRLMFDRFSLDGSSMFVSFSPFSVLGLFVVFEGLYVLWIGGGYVKRLLGYSVVLRTSWKVEILGNRPLGRCWGGPAFLGPPGSILETSCKPHETSWEAPGTPWSGPKSIKKSIRNLIRKQVRIATGKNCPNTTHVEVSVRQPITS